ncbi:hypothetical protein [Actinomadura rubrisoli]|uniref:hypothetical protein n=1 Tax=Actinomadura rubrisoli TaxID=2530368 RepID=UPI001FB59506|nr:hypothetical protein [Actinomadura rubrisoli]
MTGPPALMLLTDARRPARVHHRLHAVRGHLLEMTGDRAAARASYLAAVERARSLPERRHLNAKARRPAP